MPAAHPALPQAVLGPYFWQAPAPSHLPVWPQLTGDSVAQPGGRGGSVGRSGVQVPTEPGTRQDWQAPPQAARSQQTLSTQWPEAQSA
jgi:hypothetical protein